MLQRVPDYYHAFRCLAGRCPRSCCIGWEVEIDEFTADRYAAVAGPLGDELRAQLQADAEGSLCFPLQGERCPFLDEENLCRIHRQLGQEYTSVTCREHPRFCEEFGPLREISLSASCPEAARLLLAGTTPLSFPEEVLPEADEEADPWLAPLLHVRDLSMTLLRDPTVPVRTRMARVLAISLQAQTLLDEDRAEELLSFCPDHAVPPSSVDDTPLLFPAFLHTLAELEILETDWLPLLAAAEDSISCLPDLMLERMAEYFLFRWLLKAVNDGDLLGRVQLSIASVLAVEQLAAYTATPEEALYRYCREIEHCQENIDSLLDAFQWQEHLSCSVFFRQLQQN